MGGFGGAGEEGGRMGRGFGFVWFFDRDKGDFGESKS